ncbi:MAG: DUF2167 domain-containing protein [bacterium]
MYRNGAFFILLFFCACCISTAMGQDKDIGQDPFFIDWQEGPVTGQLGDIGEIDVPAGYLFTGTEGTLTLLEITENPPSGAELGTIAPAGDEEWNQWFVIFEFSPVGYIKNADQEELDADALFQSLVEATEEGNKLRRERGWETISLTGWDESPYYDPITNNLCWAIRVTSPSGSSTNFSTRLLGRQGYISADLIIDPAYLESALPGYENLIATFRYQSGHQYAEYREGDKVAKYGLTALIVGGAGAAAAKTGLLAKFWKFIVAGVVAIGAFLKRVIKALTGRSNESA